MLYFNFSSLFGTIVMETELLFIPDFLCTTLVPLVESHILHYLYTNRERTHTHTRTHTHIYIYIYIYISKFSDHSRGGPEGSLFNSYSTEVWGMAQLNCSTLPFDPYLIKLNIKQRGIKCHF